MGLGGGFSLRGGDGSIMAGPGVGTARHPVRGLAGEQRVKKERERMRKLKEKGGGEQRLVFTFPPPMCNRR